MYVHKGIYKAMKKIMPTAGLEPTVILVMLMSWSKATFFRPGHLHAGASLQNAAQNLGIRCLIPEASSALHVEEGGRRRKEEEGWLLSNSWDRSSFQSYLSFINPVIWVSTVPWCKRWINKQTYKHKKKVGQSWGYLDNDYKLYFL